MFSYPPLNPSASEIRLLEVHAGSSSSPISCNYQVISLDKPHVAYHTLSYCWLDGSSVEHATIQLSGHDLPIALNLYKALERVRLTDRNLLIWVDAVCINQADDVEKSQQVNMMDRVYSSCEECAVWLGSLVRRREDEETEENEEYEDSLKACTSMIETFHWMAKPKDESECSIWPGDNSLSARGLKLIMTRPWWHRIWTIQEVILAPSSTIYLGPLSIDWGLMMRATDNVFGEPGPKLMFPFEFNANGSMNDLTYTVRGLGFTYIESLTELIWRWRIRDATNDLDKVYGLYGLRSKDPSLASFPAVDYSLDTCTLYARVAAAMMRNSELSYLLGQRGERRSIPNLPSWAVDWTHPHRPHVRSIGDWFAHSDTMRHYGFDADRGLPSVKEVGEVIEDRVLCLRGICVDVVAVVETEEPSAGYGNGPASVFGALERAHEGMSAINPGFETPAFKEWLAASRDRDAPDVVSAFRSPAWNRLLTEFREMKKENKEKEKETKKDDNKRSERSIEGCEPDPPVGLVNITNGNPFLDSRRELPWRADLPQWYDEIVRNHLLFITHNGHFGFGPMNMKPGDQVWVLGGSRYPLVMSPIDVPQVGGRSTEHKDLSFVGDCFVYGIMEGEAIEGKLHEQVEVWIH